MRASAEPTDEGEQRYVHPPGVHIDGFAYRKQADNKRLREPITHGKGKTNMEENNTVNTAETVSTAESAAGAPDKPTFDQVLSDLDYRSAFDERVRAAVGRRFRTVDAQRAQMRQLAGDMARYLGLAPGEDGSVDLNALRAALNAGEGDPSSAPAGHLPPRGKAWEAPSDGEGGTSSAPAGRHLIRHGCAVPRLPATPREGRAAGGANTLGVSPQGEGFG